MEDSAEPEEVITTLAVLRVDPNGIVRKTSKRGAEYSLREAKEDLEAVIKLCPDRRPPLLADERELQAVDHDTRTFWSSKEMLKHIKAVGVVTGNSSITNMIGNFVITIARTSVPTKLFNTEAEAVKWLEWFLDDDHDAPPPSRRFFGGDLPPPSKRSGTMEAVPASKRFGAQDAPASKRFGAQDAPPPSKQAPPQDAPPPSKRSA